MKDLRNYLKPNEIEMMLDKTNSLRDYLIIRLLWKTGVRVSELINIEVNWIDFEEKMITVFGKGSKWRRTPVDRESLMHLKRYQKDKRINRGRIFSITRNRVFQIVKDISKKLFFRQALYLNYCDEKI